MSIGIQTRGDTYEISLRAMLKKRGLPSNFFSYTALVYGGGRIAAIASGSLPAAMISPMDVYRLKPTGVLKKGNMIASAYDEVRMPYSGIATSDKLLRTNRALAKRFLRGSLKGQRYTRKFREGSLISLGKRNPKAPRKALEVDYDSLVPSLTKDGTVTKALRRADAEIRAEIIGVPKNKIRPISEMWDYSLAREINRELDASGWQPKELRALLSLFVFPASSPA